MRKYLKRKGENWCGMRGFRDNDGIARFGGDGIEISRHMVALQSEFVKYYYDVVLDSNEMCSTFEWTRHGKRKKKRNLHRDRRDTEFTEKKRKKPAIADGYLLLQGSGRKDGIGDSQAASE